MSNDKVKQPDEQKPTLTVFGTETEFDGVLEFNDDLIITGKFSGRIKATGNLEITRDAICTVEKIIAKSVIISGVVTGDIEATDSVEICSGGTVKGDITTSRIRIEDNVDFEGEVSMLDTIPDSNIFSLASSEYKEALVLKSDIIE